MHKMQQKSLSRHYLEVFYFVGNIILFSGLLAIAAAALAALSLQAARSLRNLIAAQSLNRSAGGKRPKS